MIAHKKKGVKQEMKKALALFATLMIALSLAGFVYAHWTDVIYINGEAHMGELIFGFTEQYGSWDGKMVYFNNVFDYEIMYPEPKPVGTVECWLEVPETSVHLPIPKTVYKELWINITNAYPEYVAWCNYSLDNGGTIPLDIYNYCVQIDTGDGLTYGWEDDVNGDGWLDLVVARNAAGEAVLNIWFEPMYAGQIDPCNHVDQRVVIHVKEPAEECHTYIFKLFIHAWQWDP